MLQSRCASESKRPLSVLLRSGWYRSRPRTSLRSPDAADHTIESGAAAAAPAPTQTQELATAASRRRQRVGPIAGPERPSSIVRPRIGISRKRIARKRNWRSAAQPARAGLSAGGARRSAPPRARTREIRANKVNAAPADASEPLRERDKTPPISAASIGVVSKSTPYLAALARRRRPHHRIRRRGGRTSPNPNSGTGDGGQQAAPASRSYCGPRTPELHRSPQNRNISKKNCSKKKLAKRRPAGSSGSVCWRSASLGSASRAHARNSRQ